MAEKSDLWIQIADISGQNTEATDPKIHRFQLIKIEKKRKMRLTTIDFIRIRGQQNFEDGEGLERLLFWAQ